MGASGSAHAARPPGYALPRAGRYVSPVTGAGACTVMGAVMGADTGAGAGAGAYGSGVSYLGSYVSYCVLLTTTRSRVRIGRVEPSGAFVTLQSGATTLCRAASPGPGLRGRRAAPAQ
ncbi:hypothetical protein GCM10010515_10300 [Streptomyces fructofermentans]|uniref:Uncharacterized protein n=1 Tax=Streptomyces fructofermentans TaxID=152141 RepID=A0A918K375_9ACTN|nr:hypothetical protein GCM10010515_10300 [Streptomyces fructofermentans]